MKVLISTSYSSSIRDQLTSIKNGTGEWEGILRDWLTGKDSPFIRKDINKIIRIYESKQVPRNIKLKYPDVVFAIQALVKHQGSQGYFTEWEKLKKYLTFNKREPVRTFYRLWSIKETDLETLRSGNSIDVQSDSKFTSYTYHDRLVKKIKSGSVELTVMTLQTEEALQTRGKGLFLMTRHKIKPVFDLYHFQVNFLNNLKKVFGEAVYKNSNLLRYLSEREVIGPVVTEIRPKDVEGFYKNGEFNKLNAATYNIEIGDRTKIFTAATIDTILNSKAKYGNVDMTLFSNSVVVTENPDTSSLSRYVRGPMKLNDKLSEVVGFDLYTGIWP